MGAGGDDKAVIRGKKRMHAYSLWQYMHLRVRAVIVFALEPRRGVAGGSTDGKSYSIPPPTSHASCRGGRKFADSSSRVSIIRFLSSASAFPRRVAAGSAKLLLRLSDGGSMSM